MRKYLLLLFVSFFSFAFSQIERDSTMEKRTFSYGEYETPQLIKLKTDMYLSGIQHEKGVEIEKLDISDDKYNVRMYIPTDEKDEFITCDATYMFLSNKYYAWVTQVRFYYLDKKKRYYYDVNIEKDLSEMSYVRDIVFREYEKEMKSNF